MPRHQSSPPPPKGPAPDFELVTLLASHTAAGADDFLHHLVHHQKSSLPSLRSIPLLEQMISATTSQKLVTLLASHIAAGTDNFLHHLVHHHHHQKVQRPLRSLSQLIPTSFWRPLLQSWRACYPPCVPYRWWNRWFPPPPRPPPKGCLQHHKPNFVPSVI